ncbi:hypothetical protein QPK24_11105 [Paenibacillus polygoni]|uniref:Uncharacterized protein n=1 Tax=Paenibacillus polygoni TaxID=3050112 RepID=A0ABY8XB21_9BACL|nr:hypothetical protein [Paenibacillus polygoni]WIV21174.1 hypothetical protein QPK24_11105 [Paenibacillus polygoni]
MDIFAELEYIQKALFDQDLDSLEEKYFSLCCELAGNKEAERIRNIKLHDYEKKLKETLLRTILNTNQHSDQAIYFEYDLDNSWRSTFFICNEYKNLTEKDDEWACDWVDEVTGPELEKFADIYNEFGFDSSNALYLITRTVTVFTKLCRNITYDKPICIAFHDQDPIMRTKKE